MKSLIALFLLLPAANATLKSKFEQPHKQVISRCNIIIHEYDKSSRKWNINQDQYFELNKTDSNHFKTALQFGGENFTLDYVYNRKGSSWMTSDPILNESVSFYLRKDSDGSTVADSQFSAVEDTQLPSQFILRDDINNESGVYIFRVKCRTEKIPNFK